MGSFAEVSVVLGGPVSLGLQWGGPVRVEEEHDGGTDNPEMGVTMSVGTLPAWPLCPGCGGGSIAAPPS